jgi:hypothetical protein
MSTTPAPKTTWNWCSGSECESHPRTVQCQAGPSLGPPPQPPTYTLGPRYGKGDMMASGLGFWGTPRRSFCSEQSVVCGVAHLADHTRCLQGRVECTLHISGICDPRGDPED